jgi:hypothetical protein
MKHYGYKCISIFATIVIMVINLNAQTILPDELTKGSIKAQINFLEERTRIYENYRAIREDMFQKINGNFLDSLSADKNRIGGLNNLISALNHTNDSLNTLLKTTKVLLDEVTSTKNNIRVLGKDINKVTYNSIMWTIILCFIVLLAVGFLVFKRILFLKISTGKDLKELKAEFEAYRQSSRIAREKIEMDHFNEIKKLKGR